MDELKSETINHSEDKEDVIKFFNSVNLNNEDFKFMNDLIDVLKKTLNT
jgi:hypothetical protein